MFWVVIVVSVAEFAAVLAFVAVVVVAGIVAVSSVDVAGMEAVG